MKLDSGVVRRHSSHPTLPQKIVIYDYKPVETEVLTETNEEGKEWKHDITSALESKNYENLGPLPSETCIGLGVGHGLGPVKCNEKQDPIGGRANDNREVTASCFVPIMESPSTLKETALYTDKTVIDEVPEPMSGFKENVIKDICIDEGMPSFDKTLVGNIEVDHKRYFGILQSELDEYSDLTKETEVHGLSISDDSAPLVFNEQLISSEDKEVANEDKEVANDGSHKSFQERGTDSSDSVVNDISDAIISGRLRVLHDSEFGNQHADSSSSDRHEDQEHPDQKLSWDATNFSDVRSSDVADETDLAASMMPTIEVPNQSRDDVDLPFDIKAESGSIIPILGSTSQATGVRAEGTENAESQQSGHSLNASLLDDDALDSLTGSTRSSFIQHGVGESSFSGVGAVSGPLGSISFRSDSSTTSTRSFAFPILHSEWNSSPVKMAKADRKHLRRHRGWRRALLCCRF